MCHWGHERVHRSTHSLGGVWFTLCPQSSRHVNLSDLQCSVYVTIWHPDMFRCQAFLPCCYSRDACVASSFSVPPLSLSLSNQPLPSVVAPLHSVPSSFSSHLPVFCALSTLPPALSVLVHPCPLFSLVPPHFRFAVTLWPHPLPPCWPPPSPPPPPPSPHTTWDPKSSCSSLHWFPF